MILRYRIYVVTPIHVIYMWYMWYIYVIYVILPNMWYCHTGDMWLQTELLENCWNILPRPLHRRPHPGSHNMAKRHQGTPARIFFWALSSSTPCCTARPSWSTPTRFCWPTTIIIKSMKSQSSGGWKKNSFVEFVVLPIWNCSRLQSELFFVNKKNKYVWDETVQLFRKLRNIDEGLNQSDFFKMQVSRNRKWSSAE